MPMPRKPAPPRKPVMDIVDEFNARTGWFDAPGRVRFADVLREKAAKWPYFLVLYRFLETHGYLDAKMVAAAERPLPGGGRPPVPRKFSVSKGTNPKVTGSPAPVVEPEPEKEVEVALPPVVVPPSPAPVPAKTGVPSLEEIRAKLAAIKAGAVPAAPAATPASVPAPSVPPVVAVPLPPPPKPVDPLALLRASILSERYGVSLNA